MTQGTKLLANFGINTGMMVGSTIVANTILLGIDKMMDKREQKLQENFNNDPITIRIKQNNENIRRMDEFIATLYSKEDNNETKKRNIKANEKGTGKKSSKNDKED